MPAHRGVSCPDHEPITDRTTSGLGTVNIVVASVGGQLRNTRVPVPPRPGKFDRPILITRPSWAPPPGGSPSKTGRTGTTDQQGDLVARPTKTSRSPPPAAPNRWPVVTWSNSSTARRSPNTLFRAAIPASPGWSAMGVMYRPRSQAGDARRSSSAGGTGCLRPAQSPSCPPLRKPAGMDPPQAGLLRFGCAEPSDRTVSRLIDPRTAGTGRLAGWRARSTHAQAGPLSSRSDLAMSKIVARTPASTAAMPMLGCVGGVDERP